MRLTTTSSRLLALIVFVALTVAGGAAGCASAPSAPSAQPTSSVPSAPSARLDDDDLEAWSRYLAPRGSELAWESLPWLSSYSDGVLAAQEQRRPLLLWVMNGHPLGCT
jgi:uncharacterized protein YceK